VPGAKQKRYATIKKRKNGCKSIGRRYHHGEHNANKVMFFVTGEVFFLDIDLLMGAIKI
jgi:hypothetical protein